MTVHMQIDLDEVMRLQHEVFELKMSLGALAAMMQYDIDEGHTFATPTRKAELEKANKLAEWS